MRVRNYLLLNPALWRWKRRGTYRRHDGRWILKLAASSPPTRRWRWALDVGRFSPWAAEVFAWRAVLHVTRYNLILCRDRVSPACPPLPVADPPLSRSYFSRLFRIASGSGFTAAQNLRQKCLAVCTACGSANICRTRLKVFSSPPQSAIRFCGLFLWPDIKAIPPCVRFACSLERKRTAATANRLRQRAAGR